MSSDSPILVTASAAGNSPRRAELDNLIRRELRVGDPGDAKQVAQALMQRYADTASARSLVNEARGMPFLQTVTLAPPQAAMPTATGLDLEQAKDDIEADLRELLASNQLKDLRPELEGWAQAIRAALREGERCASQGMDTRQRDKTFAIRRQLGDYARTARLVGSFKPGTRDDFRSLAQSLDEASSVLLVMMGESIASSGIAGGRYLLQVPFSELQSRREAVLYALRNLMGSSQYAYGTNELPRGLSAYRALVTALEAQGQGDLRALLTENEMSRVMDQLIERAGQGVSGLRALASTAGIDVQRFQRLQAAIRWNLDGAADSPPLLALQEAIGLFTDGFRSSGGIRLMHIARPQILWYGLYRNSWPGNPGAPSSLDRLGKLLRDRGNLAAFLDANAECACEPNEVRRLVLMDNALSALDHAIDLYAMCADGMGDEPEHRAAAYGLLLEEHVARIRAIDAQRSADPAWHPALALLTDEAQNLARGDADEDLVLQEITGAWHSETQARRTLQQFVGETAVLMASYGGLAGEIDEPVGVAGDMATVLQGAYERLRGGGAVLASLAVDMPDLIEVSLERLAGAADAGMEMAHDAVEAAAIEKAEREAREKAEREAQARAAEVSSRGTDPRGPQDRYDYLNLLYHASQGILHNQVRGPVALPVTPTGEAYKAKDGESALWVYPSKKQAEQACGLLANKLAELQKTRTQVRVEAARA